MVTDEDIKTLDVMIYLLENLKPALNAMKDRRRCDCRIKDIGNIEYCSGRVHADLRKIRRLALNISKHIED